MDRRDFLRISAGGAGVAAASFVLPGCVPAASRPPVSVFDQGVASGLHSPSAVVLWTRVEPSLSGGASSVGWELATDPGFGSVVASGRATVSSSTDYCVKVLADGLTADRSYWYRFTAGSPTGDIVSPVGRARTLPGAGSSPSQLRLGFGSCQSFNAGWYQAWRQMAEADLDAVLFLGDYIYESAAGQLLGSVRQEPTIASAQTLADYRAKYRLYRTDADLQAAHAAHPLVPIWDDHEVVNDYDRQIFGDSPARVAGAYRAWFEYMPVWPISGTRIYRDLAWGDLASAFMLDTRQYRGAHSRTSFPVLVSPLTSFEAASGRSILGLDQRTWLFDGLTGAEASGTTWKIIGNQVMIAPIRVLDLDTPELRAGNPYAPKHAGLYSNNNFDSWDGFTWERDLLLRHLHLGGPGGGPVRNTVFVTGDYHSFWAAPLTTDYDDPAAPVVANEFAAGAIS
ncbi:MAG: alkaline phosphatase D family protein [Actinomycetes bacterium]